MDKGTISPPLLCSVTVFRRHGPEMAAVREVVNLFTVNRVSEYLVIKTCTETGIV